ncbi:kinesin heavy chain isoform X1 [Carassius auratus]|uniref:Kinesin heavy chain-like isoform X1 n=1 Tax=Carassius auratus TaxID=7957 RepID=A0A6P6R7L7_CARAU|nr:kinesin heavy chain-like isoform X1 [Carassius auratus]XP_026141815.1 kinesin heavy chain-like isoform X1 [Carassius auratus]
MKRMSAAKCLNTERSFRVVVRLCARENTHSHTANRPEQSVSLDVPRASIKVTHLNRVVVDTGRSHKPHIIDLDGVLNEEASQRDVYESTTKSLVEYLMQGYNGCVIVYGSPGSGKTHTMQGCSVSAKHRGIINRAAEDIFASPKASHCKIRVSFYHIFNEKIYDLLDPKGSEVVWLRDCEEVVRLDGLTEVEVNSVQDLLQVHRRGSALRHTGISKGDFPSRSHMVFNIVVINTLLQCPEGVLTASKLTLVDLASSGKCRSFVVPDKRTFNATNENPQETKMLKRSLTIFGNVIFALSSAASQHVPYRESKLTRALRDCLGGNCRTCLVVTVSSQSSLISETLSSLQFASRAMAVPSRPIYTSQLHYTPEQKDINHLTRQQILPPVGSDRKSQTCLLPNLLSSVSPSEPKLSSGHCGDGLELRTFLPQLEKPGQTEPPGHYSHGSRPGADGRTRSLPRSLSGAVFHDAGGRERTGRGSEFSSSQRRSVERLSTSSLEAFSAPSAAVECPNCSREQKLREEYDKIIVQARRDKDSLSQKVAELENELKTRATQEKQEGLSWEKSRGNQDSASSTSADMGILKTAEVCLQTEAEELRSELSKCREREKMLTQTLHSERERLTQDIQNLLTQLNSTRERNSQLVSTHNNQRESLLAELQTSREELKRFRESVSLTLSQLETEKAELMSHLEDIKSSYEKVCLENAGLRQKLKSFLREINSAPFTESSSPDTNSSHTHTVTTNTEMIVVSHQVSQQCPAGVTQGSECCFSQCEEFQHPEVEFTEKSETTNNGNCEQPLYKPQTLYKQLRREHSLLLDVMLVLYRREWFLQDAIPYVRRTLRKCGLRPEDID